MTADSAVPPTTDSEPCGCLPDAGDVGGYITDVLHERGIHDPVLQERLSNEARICALDLADEIVARVRGGSQP